MTTGYLGAGKCFDTQSAALNHHYSSQPFLQYGNDGTLAYYTQFFHDGSAWVSRTYKVNLSTGTRAVLSTEQAVPVNIPLCTLEDYQDSVPEILQLTPEQGAQIGAAIWLVWALVWGFRQVARSLNTSEKE